MYKYVRVASTELNDLMQRIRQYLHSKRLEDRGHFKVIYNIKWVFGVPIRIKCNLYNNSKGDYF